MITTGSFSHTSCSTNLPLWRVGEVGKAVMHSLLDPCGLCKSAGAWNIPLPGDKETYQPLLGLLSHLGEILSCSRLDVYSFVLLKCAFHMAVCQPHICSWGEKTGSFACSTGGYIQIICLHWLWDEPMWGTSAHCGTRSCSVSSLCE